MVLRQKHCNTLCTPTPYPRWDVAACHEMKTSRVKPCTLQQAFQILKRTKYFGIHTMYFPVFSNIQNIHFQFFVFFFSFICIVKFVVRICQMDCRMAAWATQARQARGGTLSSGVSSCAGPGGRSARSCGCTPHTGRAWPRCASGSGGSARPSARTSSRSLPRCTCRAFHQYESSGELLNEKTLYKLLCSQGNRSSGCGVFPSQGCSSYCIWQVGCFVN